VHDVTGREVAVVANGVYESGDHLLAWDGRDDSGHLSAPGLYFVQLRTSEGLRSARLVRL